MVVCIAFMIVYTGWIAQMYYAVPQVSDTEPAFLPQVLICTGVAMVIVAYMGFFSSWNEAHNGLIFYVIFCIILMVNFLIFTVLLNFGSNVLQ